MKKIFNSHQKIGEIAAIFPKATDIFMEYEIDFCCGGDRSLEIALKEQGINKEEILFKLHKSYEKLHYSKYEGTDWKIAPMTNLIDYIVQKHHAFMKKELPNTDKLINKILKVHYVDSGVLLSKLYKLFNVLKVELEEHLIKEEEIVFPLIKEYEEKPSKALLEKIIQVIAETEGEHDQAGDILKEMRKITNRYEVPETGCRSFEITYEKLQEIEADLFQHIHLENNILFERLKNRNK